MCTKTFLPPKSMTDLRQTAKILCQLWAVILTEVQKWEFQILLTDMVGECHLSVYESIGGSLQEVQE